MPGQRNKNGAGGINGMAKLLALADGAKVHFSYRVSKTPTHMCVFDPLLEGLACAAQGVLCVTPYKAPVCSRGPRCIGVPCPRQPNSQGSNTSPVGLLVLECRIILF